MYLGPSPGLALVGVWHTQEGTGCAATKVLSPTSSPSILSMTLRIRCENPHVTDEGDGGSGAEEANKDLTVGQGLASSGWNPGEDPEPPSQHPHLARAYKTLLTLQQPRSTFASSVGVFFIAHAHLLLFLSLQKACPAAGGSESKRSDL